MTRTERRRISTREALRFLTDASAALAASLEYEETLRTVAELAVPRMGCYCIVEVREEDGAVRRLATAHIEPEPDRLLRRTAGEVAQQRPGLPLERVLRTGEPVLVRRVEQWRPEGVAAEEAAEYRESMRRLGTTSFMMVPLAARGQTVGVLGLGSIRTDRFYGEDDLTLALEMARRAAVAIDNARLYRRAQRAVRARDEVLRIVSHDLRNPLGTIRMAADLMLDPELGATLDVGRHAAMIRRQTESMERLIRDLLDVARLESGRLSVEPAPVAAEALLRDAAEGLRPLADREEIGMTVDSPDGLPRVLADAPRVQQIFSNLVGNALKFTRAGGTVALRAEPVDHAVRFVVEDTGRGIPAEQLPHLFDRFWQADADDRRGIGLGLVIVRGLVDAHGGQIHVESEEGRGTTFQFTLPSYQGPAALTSAAARAGIPGEQA